MAAALLSKEENTVLVFAGRSRSELLNNAALIYLHVVGSTSHASVFIQHSVFDRNHFWKLQRKYHLASSIFKHANIAMAL